MTLYCGFVAAVDRLVVPGNTTQCILRDLIPGSNYTITVHGSTRTGKGKAVEKVFHLLNPDNSGIRKDGILLRKRYCVEIGIAKKKSF